MPEPTNTRSTVIPGMMYRNAPEALEWLCGTFGFEKHAVYPGENNTIMHAELTLGGGMMMLGSVRDRELIRQSVSLIVKDADAVYASAKAAGAEIVLDIEDKPQGGRGFTCLDPDGHTWHVGTYDPWAPK